MALDHFYIKVIKGKTSEKRYVLGGELIHAGAEETSFIRLLNRGAAPVEFVLQRSNDSYILIGKGPLPVRVNGKETRQAVLSAGSRIEVAGAVFLFDSTLTQTRRVPIVGTPDKSVTAAKRRPLILAAICVYGVMMLLVALYFMGILKPSPPAAAPTLGGRLKLLNEAAAASPLPADTKKSVVDAVTDALTHENRVGAAETIAHLRSAVELSVPINGDVYADEGFTKDPLRRWVLEEIARQRRRTSAPVE